MTDNDLSDGIHKVMSSEQVQSGVLTQLGTAVLCVTLHRCTGEWHSLNEASGWQLTITGAGDSPAASIQVLGGRPLVDLELRGTMDQVRSNVALRHVHLVEQATLQSVIAPEIECLTLCGGNDTAAGLEIFAPVQAVHCDQDMNGSFQFRQGLSRLLVAGYYQAHCETSGDLEYLECQGFKGQLKIGGDLIEAKLGDHRRAVRGRLQIDKNLHSISIFGDCALQLEVAERLGHGWVAGVLLSSARWQAREVNTLKIGGMLAGASVHCLADCNVLQGDADFLVGAAHLSGEIQVGGNLGSLLNSGDICGVLSIQGRTQSIRISGALASDTVYFGGGFEQLEVGEDCIAPIVCDAASGSWIVGGNLCQSSQLVSLQELELGENCYGDLKCSGDLLRLAIGGVQMAGSRIDVSGRVEHMVVGGNCWGELSFGCLQRLLVDGELREVPTNSINN